MIVGSAFLRMGVEMIACIMSLEWESQTMIPTPIDSTMLIYIPNALQFFQSDSIFCCFSQTCSNLYGFSIRAREREGERDSERETGTRRDSESERDGKPHHSASKPAHQLRQQRDLTPTPSHPTPPPAPSPHHHTTQSVNEATNYI